MKIDSTNEIKKALEEKVLFNIISEEQLVKDAMAGILKHKPEDVIRFGYEFLDKKLIGLFPAELMVVGAPSGIGKSSFARYVCRAVANQGRKALYFILEDNPKQTEKNEIYLAVNRMRKQQGKTLYPYEAFMLGTIPKDKYKFEMENARRIKNKDEGKNITWINGKQDVEGQSILDYIENNHEQYDVIFIDHLHYLKLPSGESRQLAIESFMRRLSSLVKTYELRVILIAHYKKLNGEKPTDESFKDAQAIPQNATTTLHIWRDKRAEEDGVEATETDEGTIIDKENVTEFYVSKVRNLFGSGNIKAYYNKELGNYDGYTDWGKGGVPLKEGEQFNTLI